MAITEADLRLWKTLSEMGVIPLHPNLVEIGQANWYGDVSMEELAKWVPSLAGRAEPTTAVEAFELGWRIWTYYLGFSSWTAIDLHGSAHAMKHDMNNHLPQLPSRERHDVLINTGTLEHVFNQGAAWENCHNLVKPGGLMVHGVPFTGWHGHCFYKYEPGFVFDLARANDYELLLLWYTEIMPLRIVPLVGPGAVEQFDVGADSMLHFALRKKVDAPFRVPMQGCYDRSLSEPGR